MERRKATPKRSSGRAQRSRRGRRAGHVHNGVLQEPGRSPPPQAGFGSPVNNPWPADVAPYIVGANQGAATVPRSEGNQATQEGRQEVGVLRITVEAGERNPRDPGKGREHRNTGRFEGNNLVGPYATLAAALSVAAAAHPLCPGHVAKPCAEEPDAAISHVRIRRTLGE